MCNGNCMATANAAARSNAGVWLMVGGAINNKRWVCDMGHLGTAANGIK